MLKKDVNKKIVFYFPTNNFISKFEIVSCHIENDGKLLFLKRNKNKPQGNTWGVPAGKKGNSENIKNAILREVKEETNLLMKEEKLFYFKKMYVRYPNYDFIYHIFLYKASWNEINIKLNDEEHLEFRWMSIDQALLMPLIIGEAECLEIINRETRNFSNIVN